MIHKVTNYSGFQSYNSIPYPSLKPGKQTLDSNTVFEKTVREQDKVSFYDNYNNMNSTYTKNLSQTVQPSDYQNVKLVKKGRQGKMDDDDNNQLQQQLKEKETKLLNGTEHWKTIYNDGIKDPYSLQKADRPEWTKYKTPYYNNDQVLPSEYKYKFGELGTKPHDKVPKDPKNVPLPDDDLKMGTTQVTKQIPGYQGFVPAAKTVNASFFQGQGLNQRTTFLKQNILENYHTRVPGYAGHQPATQKNQHGTLRQYCFSTQGEQYN